MSLGNVAGRIPGFAWEPGVNANYRAGTSTLEGAIAHITAGACGGDRAVGLRGYFTAYAPRERSCGPGAVMFAEFDATTWAQCEWNRRVFSLEAEKLNVDVDMTDYQIESCAAGVRFGLTVGIAATYRDTPHDKIPVGGPISGWTSHRSLHEVACDEHSDFWKPEEWDRIRALAVGGPPAQEDAMKGMFIRAKGGDGKTYLYVNGTKRWIGGEQFGLLSFLGTGIGMIDTQVHDVAPALIAEIPDAR